MILNKSLHRHHLNSSSSLAFSLSVSAVLSLSFLLLGCLGNRRPNSIFSLVFLACTPSTSSFFFSSSSSPLFVHLLILIFFFDSCASLHQRKSEKKVGVRASIRLHRGWGEVFDLVLAGFVDGSMLPFSFSTTSVNLRDPEVLILLCASFSLQFPE